jgi:hypothetical protein
MKSMVLRRLFQRSRLGEYASILDLAIDNGYRLTSLADWYEHDFYPGEKVMILRHDVDYNSRGALKMFLIEKAKNVKATYYFRWLTMHTSIIKKISSAGFEVSLHFETLANYCKTNGIRNSGMINEQVKTECRSLLAKEIQDFEQKFGKIKTLCSHGAYWNIKTGVPNHIILTPDSYKEYGIYFETYDPLVLSKFSSYISDSSIKANHQWKYGQTPQEAILSGVPVICLLTHPHHWDYTFYQNIRMILVTIQLKFSK